jgi:hypothetical protein
MVLAAGRAGQDGRSKSQSPNSREVPILKLQKFVPLGPTQLKRKPFAVPEAGDQFLIFS